MLSHRAFLHHSILLTFVLAALMLAACSSAPTLTPQPTTTTLPTATVTFTANPSATPTVPPTLTTTATATATRPPSPQELLAASLNKSSLPGFSWKADGGAVKLYKESTAVATLDSAAGGIRWDSFSALNPLLATPNGQKALAAFLKINAAQGIRFITSPYIADLAGQPQAALAIVADSENKIHAVPVPKDATTTWDEAGKRIVVAVSTNDGKIVRNEITGEYEGATIPTSYIYPDGRKDYSPTTNTVPIHAYGSTEIKSIQNAQQKTARIVVEELPRFVEHINDPQYKNQVDQLRMAFAQYYPPDVNLDAILAATRTAVINRQEEVLKINFIGKTNDPKYQDQQLELGSSYFFWQGSLKSSYILLPQDAMSNQPLLYGNIYGENISLIIAQAIRDNSTLYQSIIKHIPDKGKTVFLGPCDRLGTFISALINTSSLDVDMNKRQLDLLDYALSNQPGTHTK